MFGFTYPLPALEISIPATPTSALILPSKPEIESILTFGLDVYPEPPEVT